MSAALTDRQRAVYDFVCESIAARDYPPTLREVGAHMGIRSTNGVNDHLRALERKGYLTRENMKSRALRPCTPGGLELPRPELPATDPSAERLARHRVIGEIHARLRAILSRYQIVCVRVSDGKVIADLAGEIAGDIDRAMVAS